VSGFLLDTNILSEIRKRQRANPHVLRWLAAVDDSDIFVSVLVLGEIRKGIEQSRLSDLSKAQALERWLNGLERIYSDRLLSVTPAIADLWGRLAAPRPLSIIDGLLAATALAHDLTLVTRNVQHVSRTGVKLLNPFMP